MLEVTGHGGQNLFRYVAVMLTRTDKRPSITRVFQRMHNMTVSLAFLFRRRPNKIVNRRSETDNTNNPRPSSLAFPSAHHCLRAMLMPSADPCSISTNSLSNEIGADVHVSDAGGTEYVALTLLLNVLVFVHACNQVYTARLFLLLGVWSCFDLTMCYLPFLSP